ncbi:restriction endonuclease subunit S [Escherichia coli]|uniref:restriction endonuclease subunit S n=2 Tax=Escherichia coli TaxID=562 RepID=UPI000CF1304D|nr:restriction endonuclease subunit S [Escherichia coli]PPX21883.1 restriction endonuclease subunit S [Escherichia coli]RQN53711.1 restriction endonuclease subunit S [Escherichia coli]HAW2264685.1 restriction endonuclease subunit S [Escherichia coli]HAW2374066.1 restriction endonuclease subunit S [Escherichia coli]HAW3038500.1 restriction endonuclease subunit S [Escherichia coli]
MSEMSYLEKLLDGVEVEWRNLGDTSLFEIANNGRKPVKASLRIAGETPYYGANNIQDYVDGYTHDGEYVLIAEDGSASLENYSIQYATGKFWANNHVHVVRGKERVHTRFLYHYLCIVNFLPFLTGGGRAKLTKGQLIEIPVPIPCPDNPEKSLAIQSEIVRILDKFTALTAELTAELNMRKKQYNYYRDQLLNLEGRENTREMRIGDIYDFQYGTGNTIPKSGGQYPVYGSNGIVGSHDKYNSEDSPVIGHIGAYAGIVNWGQGKHFVTYNGVICRHKSKEVLQKYAYYLLLLQDFGSKSNSASQPFVSYNILNAPIVLVPPLQEQARIVAILDKFDTLTNSITEGLPREIELRQKQYEYYRDLLFSFPKPETVSN